MALVVTACGGDTGTPAASTPTSGDSPPAQIRTTASDITVGPNRLVFTILDADGRPYGDAEVQFRFFYLDGPNPDQVQSQTSARYIGGHVPAASALFSSRVDFDQTGGWNIEAVIRRGDLRPTLARTGIRVKARSDSPSVGQPAVPSLNPTLSDTPIEQLTSARPTGDVDFYRLTIAEALSQAKPLLIVFSTPAFCRARTCGPQLEAAQALKQDYGDRMNFIHIEIFQRPDLLLAGEDKDDPAVRAAVREWRMQREPLVYVIDAEGLVFDRLEGYAPREELEESVRGVLGL